MKRAQHNHHLVWSIFIVSHAVAIWLRHSNMPYNHLNPFQMDLQTTAPIVNPPLESILHVPHLINWWGYPVEEFTLTTEDGYILSMHKIPGKTGPHSSKPPVLLGHCLVGSSAIWTFGPPDKSLAYILADEGHDVFMINARGSTYSKRHVTFESCPQCKEYWDFGVEETALHDFPIAIDFVLENTGKEDLFFIGYSMGTTQYLMLLSERPEYNDKIRAGFLMAPTAFGGNVTEYLVPWAKQSHNFKYALDLLGVNEFTPVDPYLKARFVNSFCNISKFFAHLCVNFLAPFLRIDPQYMDPDMIHIYLSHMPSGASVRQFAHYAQLFGNGGQFQRYDYGIVDNLRSYGTSKPPEYQLHKVTAKTALFSGTADIFSTPNDVQKLVNSLPNVIHNEIVKEERWGHMHFVWDKEARNLVYNKVLEILTDLN